jgi:hypothetical protein
VAVDPVTHDVYLPIPKLGNRPALRVMHYDAANIQRAARSTHTLRHSGSTSDARAGPTETTGVHTRVPPTRHRPL